MVDASVVRAETTGLVLAGGEGRRMGGLDKGLVEWRGKPLVAHVATRLEAQVSTLIISCNRNHDRYAAFASQTISDAQAGFEGPLAGLLAAAPSIQSPLLALAPCDTPALPHDLVATLATALRDTGADIAFATTGGQPHYLCALLERRVLDSLPGFFAAGGRAVRHWYAQHEISEVDFSSAANAFLNVNTLE